MPRKEKPNAAEQVEDEEDPDFELGPGAYIALFYIELLRISHKWQTHDRGRPSGGTTVSC